jgi:hypothetical protein
VSLQPRDHVQPRVAPITVLEKLTSCRRVPDPA